MFKLIITIAILMFPFLIALSNYRITQLICKELVKKKVRAVKKEKREVELI